MILLILVFLLSSTTADHFSNQQPKGGNAQPQVNTEKLKQQAQELSSKMKMKVAEGTLVGDAREGQNQDCNLFSPAAAEEVANTGSETTGATPRALNYCGTASSPKCRASEVK